MSGVAAVALDGLARLARLGSDHARAASSAEEARAEAATGGWRHPVGVDATASADQRFALESGGTQPAGGMF